MKKNLFYKMNMAILPIVPLTLVVSCSKDNKQEQTEDMLIKNAIDEIFGNLESDKNQIALDLETSFTTSQESKTEEEVRQIAVNLLDKASSEQIKQILLNAFNSLTQKSKTTIDSIDKLITGYNLKNGINKFHFEKTIDYSNLNVIENFKYNSTNKTVSFELVSMAKETNEAIINEKNYSYSETIKSRYKFENIKIKAGVLKVNKNNTSFFSPTIKIDISNTDNFNVQLIEVPNVFAVAKKLSVVLLDYLNIVKENTTNEMELKTTNEKISSINKTVADMEKDYQLSLSNKNNVGKNESGKLVFEQTNKVPNEKLNISFLTSEWSTVSVYGYRPYSGNEFSALPFYVEEALWSEKISNGEFKFDIYKELL